MNSDSRADFSRNGKVRWIVVLGVRFSVREVGPEGNREGLGSGLKLIRDQGIVDDHANLQESGGHERVFRLIRGELFWEMTSEICTSAKGFLESINDSGLPTG